MNFLAVLLIIIIVLSLFCLLLTQFGFITGYKPIQDGQVFYFYMNSCPACNNFESEWNQVEQYVRQNLPDVQVTKVDCGAANGLCDNIKGVPSIKMSYNGQNYNYDGQNTFNGIVNFIKGVTGR